MKPKDYLRIISVGEMRFNSANVSSFFSVVKTLAGLIPAINRIEKSGKTVSLSVRPIISLTNCFLSYYQIKIYNVPAKGWPRYST